MKSFQRMRVLFLTVAVVLPLSSWAYDFAPHSSLTNSVYFGGPLSLVPNDSTALDTSDSTPLVINDPPYGYAAGQIFYDRLSGSTSTVLVSTPQQIQGSSSSIIEIARDSLLIAGREGVGVGTINLKLDLTSAADLQPNSYAHGYARFSIEVTDPSLNAPSQGLIFVDSTNNSPLTIDCGLLTCSFNPETGILSEQFKFTYGHYLDMYSRLDVAGANSGSAGGSVLISLTLPDEAVISSFSGTVYGVSASVPEPASYALLLLGLGMIGALTVKGNT